MKSYCNKCRIPTNQNVLKEVDVSFDDGKGWWDETNYQIIQCFGCDEISFRKLYIDVRNANYQDEGYVEELYPRRSVNSIPIKSFGNIPLKLKSIYRETIDAFNNEQFILCCGGLRVLIEGICIDKKIEGIIVKDKKGDDCLKSNLEAKIESLHECKYLTKNSVDSLHQLRFLGNDALHELSKPSISELKIAIEIIELTIENIYELTHKTMKIKSKKEDRKK